MGSIFAATLDEAQEMFRKGQYNECIRAAQSAIEDGTYEEGWPILLARAQMATGKYPEAMTTVNSGLRRYSSSYQLRLEAYHVFKANGRADRAKSALDDIESQLATLSTGRRGSRLRNAGMVDADDMLAIGRALLLLGVDPKLVLDNFYGQVRSNYPNIREVYLASGELALDKGDFDLAARTFNDALTRFPDDPDIQFGLARAYAPSDAEKMGTYLQSVLDANENHVPGMLLLVDHLIDAEQYDEALKMLDTVKKVNPWDPEAWAYRAVIANLQNETNGETTARANALKYWSSNPRVDELIGTKLSQNYRFVEGARHERQALDFDPNYLPAKIQLAQDLLRLGQETEGWELANEVHDQDGYDVTAFNLVTLRKQMAKYETITNHDFIVRMATNEAPIYGDRVLALLQRVKDTVTKKYGVELTEPTYVEIFAAQKDFGVRTFGMPHNPGFLGVCFGNVITANSPVAQGSNPENWEDVLWHEFCHVITLGITHNKMPRWLSEGISVYEERQASPTWGMRMNPRNREMILGEDLTPISELSSAFMTPKSPYHVQFAYYESSLVVEYIVQQFGFPALKDILTDLGNGAKINDAIARHTEDMPKLERDFAEYARTQALNLAPGLDWTRIDSEGRSGPPEVAATNMADSDIIKLLMRKREDASATNAVALRQEAGTNSGAKANSPKPNYWKLILEARIALDEKRWADARVPLKKLMELFPNQNGSDSAYALLAAADRQLNETNEEFEVLSKFAKLDSDDTDAFMRLMELDETRGNWPGVVENAERFLAVNPLLPEPYRRLAKASEQVGNAAPAIRAYQRLLLMDPPDPADLHYRLAKLLHKQGDAPGAKRHVMQALEDAPRFPAALQLLLELQGPDHPAQSPPPSN